MGRDRPDPWPARRGRGRAGAGGVATEPRIELPAEALVWLRGVLGEHVAIRRIALLDGSSSTVVRLDLQGAAERSLVLRLHDRPWFFDEEPDAVEREASALRLVGDAGLPAPRLIASSDREPPAVLMSFIEGQTVPGIPDRGAVLDLLERVHRLPPERLSAWRYRGYHEDATLARPPWWLTRDAWERAVRQTQTARPTAEPVVIHRDLHPGNLRWIDDQISGLVDWVSGCLGPADFDLSHLRVNLAVTHGPVAADAWFEGDPGWDIEAAFGFLDWSSPTALAAWTGPWPELPGDLARARLEAFVARALARLG